MGQANHNPASFAGGKRRSDVQRARLAKVVSQLRTQDQLDVFLESFPEGTRQAVYEVVKPMLPTLLPTIAMIEVYPVDPSTDATWPLVKACSHRVLRELDCGCWAAGYGYSVEHASQRVKQAEEAHATDRNLCVGKRKLMGHDGGFCPACGGDLEVAALADPGPNLYWPCKACGA